MVAKKTLDTQLFIIDIDTYKHIGENHVLTLKLVDSNGNGVAGQIINVGNLGIAVTGMDGEAVFTWQSDTVGDTAFSLAYRGKSDFGDEHDYNAAESVEGKFTTKADAVAVEDIEKGVSEEKILLKSKESAGNGPFVDFGIDLGTTKSIIAYCDGEDTPVIPNLITNRNFTPSAVAVDEDGSIIVGEAAKMQVLSDPANVATEFKLQMGMNKKYHFEDSGMELSPEELSAEVLKDLKNAVYKLLDQEINSAVITVPADFGPVKVKATIKAAELAGFEFTPIIMEPVAAAYAYFNFSNENGAWLIYDLGGGSFDVSVVKSENGEFENLAHSGDEYLGGNLIDWDIVTKIFAEKIQNDLGISDFERSNPKYAKQFAKLKGAAEEAKKDLSNFDNTKIALNNFLIHDNEIYGFEYTLTQDELEEVMEPYIKRTINHCNDALRKANLTHDDIDYIILAGGSTLSPAIQKSIKESFDIPLKYDIDPTAVVAKGAAQFAGTIPNPNVHIDTGSFGLKLDYDTCGPIDEEFFVTGEVISDKTDDFDGFAIELVNIKTKRSSGIISVESNGFFELEIMPEDEVNKYSITLYDPAGSIVELDENSANAIEYSKGIDVHGIAILPHTLGLGLYDDSLFILANEGLQLPYHNMEYFKTAVEVTKGDDTSSLRMSLYNGTAKIASNNEKVGELMICGNEVEESILAGSEITVTVDIDESRIMKFDVNVLDTGQRFLFEIDHQIEGLDFNEVNNNFREAKSKYSDIRLKCSEENIPDEIQSYLDQIEEENIIENIEEFMKCGKNNELALSQADKLIKKLKEILINIDNYFGEKEHIDRIKSLRDDVREFVELNGTLADNERFDTLSRELDEAILNDDSLKIDILEDAFISLRVKRGPEVNIKETLLYLIMFAEYRPEDADLVDELKEKGRIAIENDDLPAMADTANKLMELMIQ